MDLLQPTDKLLVESISFLYQLLGLWVRRIIDMPKIKKLSPEEVQKIAAGEVVERPANIVKELIENAIDAQATKINIYLKDGGKKLIRVVDNGYGMGKEDAQLCFEHHATSKITTIADLIGLKTFGFRGEALSSIASVSTIILLTKVAEQDYGTRIEVSGNKNPVVSDTSVPTGTDITVSNLFFNIPARAKFLKKKETELRHIEQIVEAFALSYPSIQFNLSSEGKQIVSFIQSQALIDRLPHLWEKSMIDHLVPVSYKSEKIEIKGFISSNHFYRYDRKYIYFFVNDRWIKNYQLNAALMKSYQHAIPHGRYPIAVLFITVCPEEVDINSHPRKEEVIFLHPLRITQAFSEGIKSALDGATSKNIGQKITFRSAYIPEEFPKKLIHETYIKQEQRSSDSYGVHRDNSYSNHHTFMQDIFITRDKDNNTSLANKKDVSEQLSSVSANEEVNIDHISSHAHYSVIGVYDNTYILLHDADGITMIDQHAAHERVLYELFRSQSGSIDSIALLFPVIIQLSSLEVDILHPWFSLLKKNGIDISPFSENQLIVHTIPIPFKEVDISAFIKHIIGQIIEYDAAEFPDLLAYMHEAMYKQMACSAAVKAGDVLSPEHIQGLLKDLYKTENRFCCPHGRPTSWLILHEDIKKKFRRDYRSYR